ncbi:Nucleotide-binding domain-containing protein [Pleurostoma richardsiae]|uniref:Nucleotide-binding domain-containing protein n=1 Tax=Pleurostoma richardsiae TaxID=41990 RepID=A0AA38RYW4_9PEZI|nr:Nucleotide-binding domain-containing protein [Pleurostoma richardsiae]
MEVLDVVIIGAGPCGLAVAARLREQTPSAIFSDEEHRRFHWMQRHGKKMPLRNVKTGRVSCCPIPTAQPECKMLVLDDSGDGWMARWKRLFRMYDISHLRSPVLWHVDPRDRDSLLSYAHEMARQDELIEIKGCVGKEVSKHGWKKKAKRVNGKQNQKIDINERDRNDYYNPSRGVFADHCDSVAFRYGLGAELVSRESAQDIDFGFVNITTSNDQKLFTVTTNKTRYYARAVVLAVGPANAPSIPSIPGMPPCPAQRPQTCHSMHITEFPDPLVKERIAAGRETNVLVIGGGLTSAQLSDLAVRRGVTKVWHLMRGPCRVKHFDVDLCWMHKFRNYEQARFWLADSDAERLEMIKTARGGGSITPVFQKRLRRHVFDGSVELCTHTTMTEARFEDGLIGGGGVWHVKTEPPIQNLPPMDYIYFATGVNTDFRSLPYLQSMIQQYPVDGCGGFPCLNDDLMWQDGVPLFVVGKLAALRLGPAAPNLGGARVGAERIAWALEELFTKQGRTSEEAERDSGSDLFSYLSGDGNKFSSLDSGS